MCRDWGCLSPRRLSARCLSFRLRGGRLAYRRLIRGCRAGGERRQQYNRDCKPAGHTAGVSPGITGVAAECIVPRKSRRLNHAAILPCGTARGCGAARLRRSGSSSAKFARVGIELQFVAVVVQEDAGRVLIPLLSLLAVIVGPVPAHP